MASLCLLRHGIAETEGADPPLSDEGVASMEAEARGMASLGLSFDAIASSPLRRAEQTARIVAARLDLSAKVRISDLLLPGCRLPGLTDLFDDLSGKRSGGAILLVGHQPDLGRITADLIGVRESLMLERGSLCCLEVAGWPPRPPATLERMLSPAFLRDL